MSRLYPCIGILALFLPSSAWASVVASDNEGDAAYSDGWQPGDNGGSGWGGGWTFMNQTNVTLTTTNGGRGWFVGTALDNNNPQGSDTNGDGDINTASTSKAWGIYSNTSGTPANTDQVFAVRPFNGALAVGQTLKWDMDNGNIASTQVVGMRLLSNAADVGSRVFEFRFVGGDSFYTVIGNPNQTSTVGFNREGLHLEYTLTAPTTWSLKIVKLVDGSFTTMTGTNANANSIVALAFKNQLAGTGVAANAYLNNIAITPEPGAALLLGLAGLCMTRRRSV